METPARSPADEYVMGMKCWPLISLSVHSFFGNSITSAHEVRYFSSPLHDMNHEVVHGALRMRDEENWMLVRRSESGDWNRAFPAGNVCSCSPPQSTTITATHSTSTGHKCVHTRLQTRPRTRHLHLFSPTVHHTMIRCESCDPAGWTTKPVQSWSDSRLFVLFPCSLFS